MPYPSYSYLAPETLRSALDMARSLGEAAATIERLTFGGAAGGRGDGGRSRTVEEVTAEWIGPTRDTFELLVGNERDSAVAATRHLTDEADAWARFWAAAINARNERLHDEAVEDYELALLQYEQQLAAADTPGSHVGLRPPRPPVRSPPVHPPTAATDYRPPVER